MSNFKLVFEMVARVWREEKVVKKLGTFARVIVAPDKDIAEQIAGAMVGEMIKDAAGYEIPGWQERNLEPIGAYEIGIGEVISVSPTSEEPAMGELPFPIPNYDYIWRRVEGKLGWRWFSGIAVEPFIVEKTHTLEEVTRIDDVVTKYSKQPIVEKHILGVKAIHNRKFQSCEEAELFLRSLQASQATV